MISNYPAHLAAALGEDAAQRVFAGKGGDKVGENAGEKLSDNQRRILLLLKQNNRLLAPLSA